PKIVFKNEPVGDQLEIAILFREGQTSSGVATEPLPQRVIPALLVRGPSTAFVARIMLLWWQKMGVRCPTVGVDRTSTILRGHALPGDPARILRPVANCERDDLACAPTLRRPEPAFEAFLADKRHQL